LNVSDLSGDTARRGGPSRHPHHIRGKQLVCAADTGDRATAHFTDETSASAGVLIGADGIRSTVRALIDPAAPQPRYAGLLGFGARRNDTRLPSKQGTMHLIFGKCALLRLPGARRLLRGVVREPATPPADDAGRDPAGQPRRLDAPTAGGIRR